MAKKYDLQNEIDMEVEKYIESTEGNLVYISDHALIRYMEREKGFKFKSNIQQEMIKELPYPPEKIRAEMLTRSDQEKIVRRKGERFRKNDLTFVVKSLTVITVLKE